MICSGVRGVEMLVSCMVFILFFDLKWYIVIIWLIHPMVFGWGCLVCCGAYFEEFYDFAFEEFCLGGAVPSIGGLYPIWFPFGVGFGVVWAVSLVVLGDHDGVKVFLVAVGDELDDLVSVDVWHGQQECTGWIELDIGLDDKYAAIIFEDDLECFVWGPVLIFFGLLLFDADRCEAAVDGSKLLFLPCGVFDVPYSVSDGGVVDVFLCFEHYGCCFID